MEITKISDLKDEVFLRSALIPIDYIEEIFSLSDRYSSDQILGTIFRKSLRDWEYHHPLIHESRVTKEQMCSTSAPEGYCEIKDNFGAYLKCIIGEDQIILIPNVTPHIRLSGSYPYPGTYTLPIDYKRPYISLGNMMDTQLYLRGICNRPCILEYNPDKTLADNSAIYWMNIREGIPGQKFVDQCLVNMLEYVKNLKGNLMLPGLGVDIFASCENYWMNLKQELDQYYLQSSWRGELLI